jgi:hypothetical protein
MNDEEFAEILQREKIARAQGWKSNAYTCVQCTGEGKTRGNSTYVDWPIYFDELGNALCHIHGAGKPTGARLNKLASDVEEMSGMVQEITGKASEAMSENLEMRDSILALLPLLEWLTLRLEEGYTIGVLDKQGKFIKCPVGL